MRIKRAVLVKMRNGKHRVASPGEVKEMNRADAAIVESNNQRSRALAAMSSLSRAREDAANDILRMKYLPAAVNEVVEELTSVYGPELMKHAAQLKRSDRTEPLWIKLSATFDPRDLKVLRVRGEIPCIRYEVAIME